MRDITAGSDGGGAAIPLSQPTNGSTAIEWPVTSRCDAARHVAPRGGVLAAALTPRVGPSRVREVGGGVDLSPLLVLPR